MIPKFPSYVFIDDSSLVRGMPSNVLRSSMEVGPQKTRPIQTIPLFTVSMDISFCDDKLSSFKSWFRNDIGSGAYWFIMNDPFDGVKRRFRFSEDSSDFSFSKNGNLYRTGITLEAYDEL